MQRMDEYRSVNECVNACMHSHMYELVDVCVHLEIS